MDFHASAIHCIDFRRILNLVERSCYRIQIKPFTSSHPSSIYRNIATMFGFSFNPMSKDEPKPRPHSQSQSSTSLSQTPESPSCSLNQKATTDSDFDFIVIKQVDSRPLYTSQSPSHLSPYAYSQPSSRSRSHSRSSHSSTSSVDWNDAVLRDSAVAFGSQRRHSKSKRSSSRIAIDSSTSGNSRRPSTTSLAPSSPASVSVANSRSSSRHRSSVSSVEMDEEAQIAWDAWQAFRAKYASKHDKDEEEIEEQQLAGGRYGAGRGYVEYTHRKSCQGDCEGRCFGK